MKALLWIASVVLFIELLDTTLLYSSIVPVAHDFGINAAEMSLPMIAYIAGTCIFIPASAWLANRFDRIHFIILTLIVFALFSVLCSVATGLYSFAIFRFMQGIAISICFSITIITLLALHYY